MSIRDEIFSRPRSRPPVKDPFENNGSAGFEEILERENIKLFQLIFSPAPGADPLQADPGNLLK